MYEKILTMKVNVTSINQMVEDICETIKKSVYGYICVSNVHMCMEVFDNHEFRSIVNNADWVIPDGKPLALGLRLLGQPQAQQVRGADITRALCELAQRNDWVIGLYGGSQQVLEGFTQFLANTQPDLKIGCAISPPFRTLSEQEDKTYIQEINNAHVQILFVGLGCPKQEKWMAQHKGEVNAIMLGVGAVFDFLSGHKKEAPRWVQSVGFEWLFRLISEPRRLWKRYLKHNPRFVWYFIQQWLFSRKFD